MRQQRPSIALAGALVLAISGPAVAGQHADDAGAPYAQTAAAGFNYASGGVGKTAQAAMERRYGDYPFKLITARRGERAAYVADVAVSIRDGNGRLLLETATTGPWLMVDLPPESYTLEASFEGRTKTRKLNLSENEDKRLVLRWGG